MKIALVSCCKTKLPHEAVAKEIYTGDLFKKVRGYAERDYDEWAILSALLGLVQINETIEPYEFTLIGKSKKEKQEWANRVFYQIIKHYTPNEHELHIFAGMEYRQYLIPLLEQAGFKVDVPLQGLGIGQQKSWLKKELSA